MTRTEGDTRFEGPFRTDDQLRIALEDLLMRANLPQLWWIFLDSDDRLTGPFMPGGGYPDDPFEIISTDDLGDVPAAEVLAARVGYVADFVGAGSAVLVWECPGPDALSAETRVWVREMSLACRAADVPLRMQLLLHDDGLRVLVPDDFIS